MDKENNLNQKSKISRNVVIMGLVSLFNDIASEMIYPIVPIFLTTVLAAPATVIGVIEGVAESTASILKVVSGWISDKIQKRKAFVSMGYSLSAISKLFLAAARSWPFVLFARFIDRFGKGARTSARDALIAESAPPELRGRAFGLHRAMDSAGAVVGPLLSLILIWLFANNMPLIFFLAFIPAAIGVILLIFFVKEKPRQVASLSTTTLKEKFKFRWSELDPAYKLFLFVSVIFAIGNSSDAFLILRAHNLGLSVTLTVAAYVLFNLTYSAISYPAGILSDKIGPKKNLLAGFVLFAAVYTLFGYAPSPNLVWILFPLYGIYMALTDGVSKAYISGLVPTEKSGTAFGLYYTATGICVFAASFLAGLLWRYVSPGAPFYFGAVMAIIAAFVFFVSRRAPRAS